MFLFYAFKLAKTSEFEFTSSQIREAAFTKVPRCTAVIWYKGVFLHWCIGTFAEVKYLSSSTTDIRRQRVKQKNKTKTTSWMFCLILFSDLWSEMWTQCYLSLRSPAVKLNMIFSVNNTDIYRKDTFIIIL